VKILGEEMICDKVFFKGQAIITIYHQRVDGTLNRSIKQTEKIGRYNLVFTETVVDDNEIDSIVGWNYTEKGLLEPSLNINPYSDAACAQMRHFVYLTKPDCMFRFDKQYSLKISVKVFLFICEFIEKYTGMELQDNPMLFGDVFVFMPNEEIIKHNKENGLIIKNIPADSTVITHFKNKNLIVYSKKEFISSDTESIEIKPDVEWHMFDIEIFNGDKLIYYKRNAPFIMAVNIGFTIKGEGKRIKQSKNGLDYIMNEESNADTIRIGERKEEKELLSNSSSNIIKRIKLESPDDQVLFIKPGEIDIAKKIIGQVLESAQEELWIFDSYFSDRNDILKNLDWLRIIVNCKAKNKNIVFYQKDSSNALNIDEIKKEMEKDTVLQEIQRSRGEFGIHFYQGKQPIHDRFVFAAEKGEYKGVSIGTSFNSLDRNHYCISKLSHSATKLILNELKDWLKDNHVVSDKEV
jgi:hypothetical protein